MSALSAASSALTTASASASKIKGSRRCPSNIPASPSYEVPAKQIPTMKLQCILRILQHMPSQISTTLSSGATNPLFTNFFTPPVSPPTLARTPHIRPDLRLRQCNLRLTHFLDCTARSLQNPQSLPPDAGFQSGSPSPSYPAAPLPGTSRDSRERSAPADSPPQPESQKPLVAVRLPHIPHLQQRFPNRGTIPRFPPGATM